MVAYLSAIPEQQEASWFAETETGTPDQRAAVL